MSTILQGSIRISNREIRVTAQLIDSETDCHLWSDTWSRNLGDILEIQDDLSAAIVSGLSGYLFPEHQHTDGKNSVMKINADFFETKIRRRP